MGSYQNCTNGGGTERLRRMTSLSSFQGKKIKSAAVYRAGSEVVGIVNVLHGSDPVRIELGRLGNEVRVITVLGNADGGNLMKNPTTKNEDHVSGTLYDMLQKEVIALQKACHEKDQSLKHKDDSIEILAKKVETLNKAMEVEAKKMRREVAVMEKEFSAMHKGNGQDQRKSHTLDQSRNGR